MSFRSPQTTASLRIEPGRRWLDNRGRPIQAHGGAVVRSGDLWYWFGEDRSTDNDPSLRCVSCYASSDLVNWEFRNQSLALSDPEGFGPEWILERPKVFYSAKTKRFVMYMHIDGRLAPDHPSRYSIARMAIATSATIDGKFEYVRSFRPFGMESRDIGQFIDDDGSPYIIFESRPSEGFYIAPLSDDCLNLKDTVAFIRSPLEGGAIVRYEGLYYMIGSKLTGWWPNENLYATAPSLAGPWSAFRSFAPAHTCTFGSQSTNLLKVVGTRGACVIYLGDIWNPYELSESRYLWYPLSIGDGELQLAPDDSIPGPWTLDAVTGIAERL